MIVDEVEVVRAERISPSFVRVELGGPCLADLGVEGPWLDQRVKLVLPDPRLEPLQPREPRALPALARAGADWWAAWQALPERERGAMRTYTVRDVVGSGTATRLVVDVVVHAGASGPGSAWAGRARAGDRVLVVAPRRGEASGGREFAPGAADRLLLVADETAVPAVAGILRDLPTDAVGTALLEVPASADVQALAAPDGVEVVWLPRDGAVRGRLLRRATGRLADVRRATGVEVEDPAGPLLWETPEAGPGRPGRPGRYAWVAGESGVVTALRRHLVREQGLDRRRVAFMGYWREGVAMRA